MIACRRSPQALHEVRIQQTSIVDHVFVLEHEVQHFQVLAVWYDVGIARRDM